MPIICLLWLNNFPSFTYFFFLITSLTDRVIFEEKQCQRMRGMFIRSTSNERHHNVTKFDSKHLPNKPDSRNAVCNKKHSNFESLSAYSQCVHLSQELSPLPSGKVFLLKQKTTPPQATRTDSGLYPAR